MRSRLLLITLILASISLLVVNFAIPEEHTVRVVTPPAIIASLPHWIAEERHFYAESRLQVETLNITGSDLMVQALISNDADVLPAVSLADVINASAKSPIKPLIFSHSRMKDDPPFEALIVLPTSRIASLRDLAGKRIAVYPGPTSKAAVDLYLKRHSVNTASIEYIPLPPPEHLQALQRGDVDASHIYEPLRTANLMGDKARMLSGSVYAYLTPNSAIGVSAMSSKFYREKRKAAEAYLKAWDRSIEYIRTHDRQAREILQKHLHLTPQVAMQATWVDATRTTEVDVNAVRATAGVLKENGLIPKDIEIDSAFFLPRNRR